MGDGGGVWAATWQTKKSGRPWGRELERAEAEWEEEIWEGVCRHLVDRPAGEVERRADHQPCGAAKRCRQVSKQGGRHISTETSERPDAKSVQRGTNADANCCEPLAARRARAARSVCFG